MSSLNQQWDSVRSQQHNKRGQSRQMISKLHLSRVWVSLSRDWKNDANYLRPGTVTLLKRINSRLLSRMDLSMAYSKRNLAIETVAKSCKKVQISLPLAKSSLICKVWLTKDRKEVWKLRVSPLNSVRWIVIDTCQPLEKSTRASESRMTSSDACRDRARLSQSMLPAILSRVCHPN